MLIKAKQRHIATTIPPLTSGAGIFSNADDAAGLKTHRNRNAHATASAAIATIDMTMTSPYH